MKQVLLCFSFLFTAYFFGQDIELYQQFNGHYDYLAFGNTLNEEENGVAIDCTILTQSSAELQLATGQTVVAAYLYWSGSGTGDFEVALNGTPITSERNFSYELDAAHTYFAAFADVTSFIQSTGNGTYTLSNLDLTGVIIDYCGNATNYGGWAITIIYDDPSVPLNQVNIFDGMVGVSQNNTQLDILLENLNVLDNTGAKIGFLAWEGDSGIAVNETLRINGTVISNPPLNPSNNAFNGTNSFTGSDTFYNMDLDFYNIENNIQPGDETALIQLTSGQDLVMVNNIVTVLNTELPDASITIDNFEGSTVCGDLELDIQYTVYNLNSTAVLPVNTSIGFFADNTLLATAQTTVPLDIDASESGSITITVPETVPPDFQFRAFVDYLAQVAEINEDNNEDNLLEHLLVIPEIVGLTDLETCEVVGDEFFDLTNATAQIDPENTIDYFLTEDDAINETNAITNPETFQNTENPQTIWIRVSNPDCFVIDSFEVEILICPLPDATVSIDNDIYACRQRDLTIEYTVYNSK
ncbi:MAG: gliding motility-associated C-terminal domain-containing protein, partial [Bacteroidetes bacterium]|nr:gliding motility-associated C-terminal domain-containing protein [Bacteroidota bacterium]